ncbi:MAG TPA: hypothetical protein VFD33_01645 [Bacillota bacterium]|nr:hypothetical protein [Bacillota bacterium]
MTRRERRIRRKKKRRVVVLSLLACLLVFLGGIYTVDEIMRETIGLPAKKGIFSLKELGQASGKKADIENSNNSDGDNTSANDTYQDEDYRKSGGSHKQHIQHIRPH